MDAEKAVSSTMEFMKMIEDRATKGADAIIREALAEIIRIKTPPTRENSSSTESATEETDPESTEEDKIIVVDDEPTCATDLTKDFVVIEDYPPPCVPQVYSQHLFPQIADFALNTPVNNFLFSSFEYEKPLMDCMVHNQPPLSFSPQLFRPWLAEENNVSSLYDNYGSVQWDYQSKAPSYHSRYGYHYLNRMRPYPSYTENSTSIAHHFAQEDAVDAGTMEALIQLVALSVELRMRNDAMFGPH